MHGRVSCFNPVPKYKLLHLKRHLRIKQPRKRGEARGFCSRDESSLHEAVEEKRYVKTVLRALILIFTKRTPNLAPLNSNLPSSLFLSPVHLGSTAELPAESCGEIKRSEGAQTASGTYWLHSSITPGEASLVYCDMITVNGKVTY